MEVSKVTTLAWRKFLQTQAGLEGMLYLRSRTPSIPKGQPHEMIFDGGRVQGYAEQNDAIANLLGGEPAPKDIEIENK